MARDLNIEKQPSFIYLHTYAKPKQQVKEVILYMYYKK